MGGSRTSIKVTSTGQSHIRQQYIDQKVLHHIDDTNDVLSENEKTTQPRLPVAEMTINKEENTNQVVNNTDDDDEEIVFEDFDTISFRQHLKDVSSITYPIILSEIFQNTLPVVDIAFVGRLDKEDLAAVALATVWFNLWNFTMVGFMTAIDTLLAQSFGAKEYKKFGIWTGNSLIIVLLFTIIISILVAFCGPAMKLLVSSEGELADAAGQFSYRLIPGLIPYYMFKVLTKFLQTQNILAPLVWIGILANVMNAFFNWAFIFALDWGIDGAPWATSLTRTVELILILVYIYCRRSALKETWPTYSQEYLTRDVLRPFWKLAISGALSVSLDAWSFEITTILAGRLGVVQLDAHILTFSITGFMFLSFPFAVGIAASIRVGQLIGDGRADDAKRSSTASFLLNLIIQSICVSFVWSCSEILGDTFASDEEVADLMAALLQIGAYLMMCNVIHPILCGVLRGLGRQKLILFLSILSYWVLQLPIGIILTFVADLGVKGFWWGFVIGLGAADVVAIYILRTRVDWEKETKKAVQRLSTIVTTEES